MKILVVEDETVVARRLLRMLAEILGDHASLTHRRTLDEAMDWLRGHPVDALFLDLNLAGKNGFDILAEAVAGPQQTIVVSANTERAVEAFEYGVLDFVAKPFDAARLRLALDRLEMGSPAAPPRYLAVRGARGIEMIVIDAIVLINGAGNYAEVVLGDGRRVLHDKSLDALTRLLPAQFQRAHRSHILNLNDVARLQSLPGSRYRAVLKNGDQVPVSRGRIKDLRQQLI